jgi:hypothetical protein
MKYTGFWGGTNTSYLDYGDGQNQDDFLPFDMLRQFVTGLAWASTATGAAFGRRPASSDNCPGYATSNITQTANGLTADLRLAGPACNVYGNDIQNLKLLVNYDSGK